MEVSGAAIVKRIDETLMERKESRINLSKATGIPVANISHWSTRNSIPKVDDIFKISKYLKVSPYWLIYGMDEDKDADKLTQEEIKLLSYWRLSPSDVKKSVLILLRMLKEKQENDKSE